MHRELSDVVDAALRCIVRRNPWRQWDRRRDTVPPDGELVWTSGIAGKIQGLAQVVEVSVEARAGLLGAVAVQITICPPSQSRALLRGY